MSAEDRAAEVLYAESGLDNYGVAPSIDYFREQAQGLAAAGLLVTDEIQAVLDAAENLARRHLTGKPTRGAYVRLYHAVDAYLASRQP